LPAGDDEEQVERRPAVASGKEVPQPAVQIVARALVGIEEKDDQQGVLQPPQILQKERREDLQRLLHQPDLILVRQLARDIGRAV
ncbi:MAG: hypothetical protein C4321_07415, partial [Chloroflexota bacterium]